jgi:hypothetical protein
VAFHQIMEVGVEFGLICYVPVTPAHQPPLTEVAQRPG